MYGIDDDVFQQMLEERTFSIQLLNDKGKEVNIEQIDDKLFGDDLLSPARLAIEKWKKYNQE